MLAPVGTLQAGAHASIQNELGSFPVSGTYTILAGDQIKIGKSESNAVLALDIGTLYIRPESSLILNETNGIHTVTLLSGSIGYQLDGNSTLKITSAGKEITPIATDGTISGVVALGPTGLLVVSPVLGDAIALADDGVVITITQGNTWTDAAQGAKLTPTQVEGAGGMSTAATVGVVIGVTAGGVLIYNELKKDNSKSNSG